MSKIKELPWEQRPREKAYRYGIDLLSNDELLALIIGSGSVGNSALDIATSLLRDFRGLNNLSKASYQDFIKYKGLNKISSLKLASVFTLIKRITKEDLDYKHPNISKEEIANKYYAISYEEQENFIVIVLNKRKEITYESILYKGTNNKISCSYREIYRIILLNDGYYFYIIHNHPNGLSKPSIEDIEFTQDLMLSAKRIKLQLIDHIIISKDGWSSIIDSIHHNWT